MKQIYSTGLIHHGTNTGSALRASSAGIAPDEVHSALNFAGYSAPVGNENSRPLPVRLALLQTSQGRVLTHITPGSGKYFAHTLLNVPASADAQLAIQTWGSPQWQKQEPDNTSDLPELPYLPVADILDDANLREWLANPARQELLEFALTALMGTPSSTRIFLAATSEDLAKVVYAVTRVLPPGLLEDFTFSTYEAEPLSCQARLIGHELEADTDLPEGCYAYGNVAFNSGTGRRSDLTTEVPFARFATKAGTTGEYGPLDEVKSTWHRLGLKDAQQFDLVYRLTRGTGVMTKAEATETLQHPPLAAWISTRQDALNQFLDWALEDRDFATASFTRAVQALRQKPETTAKLAQTVREAGLKALKANDRARTATALEVILPMVAPTKANAIWGELVGQLTEPKELAWEMRSYLLPKFVRFKQQQGVTGVDSGLSRWLDVPVEKLSETLALDLPRHYHLATAKASLERDGEPTTELTTTLAQHPSLTLNLLQPSESTAEKATALFEKLLTEAPQTPWFEQVLGKASDYPSALLNRFFEATLVAGKVDADRLIRINGPRILELFQGQSGLDKVGTQLLANPPVDLLRNAGLLEFLRQISGQEQVSPELKTRIHAVQTIKTFLDAPSFDAEKQSALATAMAVTPPVVPSATKLELFHSLTSTLSRSAHESELQSHLETSLLHLGPVLANHSVDLYENVLRELRTTTDFAKHENLVPTFLAVALGATKSSELTGKLDGLEGHAFAIAADAAKRGGVKMLATIDAHAEAWPKQARTQWGFLSAAVRPRGSAGLLRDVALVAAGVIAASVIWLIVLAVR
jgi:GTPase-associated protein 1, N-terminal domain type 2/GTPase-associated protein 1, middle domain